MKKTLFFALFFFAAAQCVAVFAQMPDIIKIEAKEKQKVRAGENYYFEYVFPSKPKLGTSVIKISVFDNGGVKTQDLEITGSYDMPQMRGRHSSGPVKFQINKSGDYLMPLNSVMRGKWEIRLVFSKDGEEIFSGAININI
jgi:hypothetical protein